MRARAIALLLGACVLAGCGTSDRDQVQSKIEQFFHAVTSKDYPTLCQQVLAPGLLARMAAGGISCEQAMRISLGGLQNPILSVGRITVSGSTATVIALTGASGQRGSIDAIKLIKTSDGWRVSSLGTAGLGGAGG
jgi:hypothetical protein